MTRLAELQGWWRNWRKEATSSLQLAISQDRFVLRGESLAANERKKRELELK